MHENGTVPTEFTVPVSRYHVCMKDTSQKPVRCIALDGTIGLQVSCSIYTLRSSTCREFEQGQRIAPKQENYLACQSLRVYKIKFNQTLDAIMPSLHRHVWPSLAWAH